MDRQKDDPPRTARTKRPYEKPAVRPIELSLEESLANSCKVAGACDQPPAPSFNPGS